MFDKNCRENQNTHFVFGNFKKIAPYCRTRQATGGNMAHMHCMLYT